MWLVSAVVAALLLVVQSEHIFKDPATHKPLLFLSIGSFWNGRRTSEQQHTPSSIAYDLLRLLSLCLNIFDGALGICDHHMTNEHHPRFFLSDDV